MTKVADTWHRRAKTFGTAAAVILFSSDMSSANGMDAAGHLPCGLVDSLQRERAPRDTFLTAAVDRYEGRWPKRVWQWRLTPIRDRPRPRDHALLMTMPGARIQVL